MAPKKKSKTKKKIPEPERLKLWVRAGGRCEICGRYMLEGENSAIEATFGQAAHIVGQTESELSPRGTFDALPDEARDNADNLMLLCDDEHSEIDKIASRDSFSVEFLRALKKRREDHVLHVTGFNDDRRTTPLRVIGDLRGAAVEASRPATAVAVMEGAGRFPRFDLSTRDSLEIDLRKFPGEDEPTTDYYRQACAAIDRVVDNALTEAIRNEDIQHLSVFAFARLPLLVYLGHKLNDTWPVDIYQRHRTTQGWSWPNPDATATFSTEAPNPADGDEAVLIMNISGTIQDDELPSEVADLPIFRVTLDGERSADSIGGPLVLAEFESRTRTLLGQLEEHHKRVKRLHLFLAAPLSAAVVLGRTFEAHIHPSLAVYDRTDMGYVSRLEVGT